MTFIWFQQVLQLVIWFVYQIIIDRVFFYNVVQRLVAYQWGPPSFVHFFNFYVFFLYFIFFEYLFHYVFVFVILFTIFYIILKFFLISLLKILLFQISLQLLSFLLYNLFNWAITYDCELRIFIEFTYDTGYLHLLPFIFIYFFCFYLLICFACQRIIFVIKPSLFLLMTCFYIHLFFLNWIFSIIFIRIFLRYRIFLILLW